LTDNISSATAVIRHAIATIVYRGSKTLRDVSPDFATYRVKPDSRSPVEIIAHIGDLFDWSLSMLKGEEHWHASAPQEWDFEIRRFFVSVGAFDAYLAGGAIPACPLDRLFQGPIADAMTHVGQLAMLRHLFGAPIIGENYFKADIRIGQVGPAQPPPRRVFD
jgi:hypothetical protein